MNNPSSTLLKITTYLLIFSLLDLIFTTGIFTDILLKIIFGWYGFINHNLLNIPIHTTSLTLVTIFFLLLILVSHIFAKWFYRHYQQKNWKLSWTISGIIMLLLVACVGISSIVTIHHLLWLKRDRIAFSDFEIRIFFSKTDALIAPVKKAIVESYANNSQSQDLSLWKSQLPNQNYLNGSDIEKISVDNTGVISIIFDNKRFYVANKSLLFMPKPPEINKNQPFEWICKTNIEPSYRKYKKGECQNLN